MVTWTISPGGTFKNKYCKLRKGTPQFVLIILRISKKKKKERKDFLGNFLKQNRQLKCVCPLCSGSEVVESIPQTEHQGEIIFREYPAYLKGSEKWISKSLWMILYTQSPLFSWHKENVCSSRRIPCKFSIYDCIPMTGTDQQPSSLSSLNRFIFLYLIGFLFCF